MNPPPKKSGARGLYILLAIVGGGALLVAIGVGIVFWRIWSDPEGRAKLGQVGEALRVASKAQSAPGTKELRKLGCGQALVMNMEDIAKIAVGTDASAEMKDEMPFGEMIMCAGQALGTPPSCADVVQTYVKAVGARPRNVLVTVTRGGSGGEVCSSVYDGKGNFVSDGKDGYRTGPPIYMPEGDEPDPSE